MNTLRIYQATLKTMQVNETNAELCRIRLQDKVDRLIARKKAKKIAFVRKVAFWTLVGIVSGTVASVFAPLILREFYPENTQRPQTQTLTQPHQQQKPNLTPVQNTPNVVSTKPTVR